jgi:putative GTP pyrophosphokinase
LPGEQEAYVPVKSCQSRIKSAESMRKKLQARGLKTNLHSAPNDVYDAVGIRIICGFVDDVYKIAAWIEKRKEFEILQCKDYFVKDLKKIWKVYSIV